MNWNLIEALEIVLIIALEVVGLYGRKGKK